MRSMPQPPLRSIEDVLADPTTSHWLKVALQSLVERDAVAALNDALVLAALLEARSQGVSGLEGHRPKDREDER
jgi:hypothetical protein